MKKKLILLFILCTVASSGNMFGMKDGFSFGIQGNLISLNDVFPRSAELTFKLRKCPALIGLGYSLQKTAACLRFDWWLYKVPLVGALSVYSGPGIGISLDFKKFSASKLGLRVPIGVQISVIKSVELFIELVPMVIFILEPDLDFLGSIGARFWL